MEVIVTCLVSWFITKLWDLQPTYKEGFPIQKDENSTPARVSMEVSSC